MRKRFKPKPEFITAMQFTGTPENARDIVAWVKESVGGSYQSSRIRELETKHSFGDDVPHAVNNQICLYIYTQYWTIGLIVSDWLFFSDVKGWRGVSNVKMSSNYEEDSEEI